MNYLFLALAIFAAVMALISLSNILRVAVGKARFTTSFAPTAQALYVAGFGTLAAWLFSLAFA